jgi:hypothetical protein
VLRLEGYEYDVGADFLTARVVRVGGPKKASRPASGRVPVGYGLRRLIHATLTVLSHALASGAGAETVDQVDTGRPGPQVV